MMKRCLLGYFDYFDYYCVITYKIKFVFLLTNKAKKRVLLKKKKLNYYFFFKTMKRKAITTLQSEEIKHEDGPTEQDIEAYEAKLVRLDAKFKLQSCKKDQVLGRYFTKYIDDLIHICEAEAVNIPESSFYVRETWPSQTPTAVKLLFLNTVGSLGFKTDSKIIAKYIRTLENLFSNEDAHFIDNIQNIYANGDRPPGENSTLIEINLAFCAYLKPAQFLQNTSFVDFKHTDFAERIKHLQIQNRENMQLYRQIIDIANARLNKLPLPVLHPEVSITPLDEKRNDDDIELLPHQKLQDFLLNKAASRGLRKSKTGIYSEQFVMPSNVKTNWFKYEVDFMEWIWDVVGSPAVHFFEHYALTKGGYTARQMVDFLTQTKDPRLPFLKKRRTLFSYENGMFDAVTGRFHLYNRAPTDFNRDLSDYNVGYADDLKSDEQSANFFSYSVDLRYFEKGFNSFDIETPGFDKILNDQDYQRKDIKWFQFALGRLLHDVGSIDNYQVALFLPGTPGSGKSSILGKFSEVYESVDIGTIMDDAEQNFTDQHLIGKYMVVGLDVSKDMAISGARFNLWTSGIEVMTVNIKHGTALSMKWKAPMCFASNEFPAIRGKGSQRRFLFFMFTNAIVNSNTHLIDLLTDELPRYLIKCALQYLRYCKKFKTQALWERRPDSKNLDKKKNRYILPDQCHKARKEHLAKTSFPDAFLDSLDCEFDKDFTCSKKELVMGYEFFLSQLANRAQGSLHSKRSPESCTATNFNYALATRACRWDTTKDIITGLRISKNSKAASSVNSGGEPIKVGKTFTSAFKEVLAAPAVPARFSQDIVQTTATF